MAELEITDKLECLPHGDIPKGLESHVGNGTARKSVTNNVLRNDVQTGLLVGNSLDEANGEGEEGRKEDG